MTALDEHRMEARSEFEDTDARLAQDQLAAELNELRERAARGDKQAAKELRGREVAAKKAAKEKSKLIGRLDDMRKQRDALKRSREYADLRRTRETGGTLTKKQEKTLEGFEKQDERLGSAIFDLEGRIYEISEQADLASVAASGPGDRPFRGFSAEEAEHAGMFEQRARERATAEEKAMLDRLEEEWRARQKIFEERRARARAEQEARERAGRGRDQRESTSTGPKPTGEGTGEAAPPRDGVYGTNEDGFVTSTNGEPIQFGHQRDAGWWILKVGNKASGGQVFEIANHPSGNGFTVRETHRNGPTGGKADEGRNAGSGKGESGGGARAEESRAGGPLEARGELPRSETNQTRRDAESDQASQEILALARSVAENRSDNTRRTVTYGRASERVIDLLKAHGIDATRYVHVVDNFAIGHTLKNHGNEKIESARGQVAITPEDFAKIPEVVSFPDKVEWDGKTRVGRDAIRYTKRFNGHLIVVEEVRTGRNRLALTSMRKTRATRNATSASNPKSPAPTSETLRAQSDESIAGKPGEEQGQPPNPTPNQPKGISDKQRAYRERLRKRGVARRIIDAGDTLMEAIIKLGGIHESLRGDLIGDSKGNRNIPFVGYLFNKTGTHDLSDLANQLGEGRWYFTPQELADVDGGAALLAERLRTEYDGGEPHRSYDDQDKTDAEYEQALRDREWELYERARADAEARGIPWDENQSVESAVDAYYARQQEDIAALEKELADAYKEAEALMGDRVDDIFEEGGRDPDESWYRANIKALEDAIEEENAYRENIRTRETDAGREEESDFDGSRDDSDDRDSQEAGGAPGEAAGRTEGGESSEAGSRDEFTLKSQSEAELKKRAEEEEAARAREEAEKRRTEAEERKAREQKEIADRQEESARNFKLGESAEDSLSGQGDLLSDTPPNTKPDSGTLYANPFHKALGWFLGDSRAWADSLNELRRSIADLKKSAGVTVRSNPVVAFARAFFESSSADMRAAIRLNPSKTAEWVVDQFHDRAGGGKATGETFGHALAAKVSRAMVDLHRALGDLVHDEAGMEQVARMLRSGTARAGTRLGNAAIALRKMLDDELKYLREAGVDVGEVSVPLLLIAISTAGLVFGKVTAGQPLAKPRATGRHGSRPGFVGDDRTGPHRVPVPGHGEPGHAHCARGGEQRIDPAQWFAGVQPWKRLEAGRAKEHEPAERGAEGGVAAVVGACGYAAVAGFALPTVRTALMIGVILAARLARRAHGMADALGLAALVVGLVDPLALLTPGFWLSFCGVAWLLWCLPPGSERNPLHGLVSAQAVATLGLLPLTVVLFGQASLSGPVANLVAVPWWSLVVVPLALLGTGLETLHAGAGTWAWHWAATAFGWSWPGFTWLHDSGLALWWLPEPAWYALPLALLAAFWVLLPRTVPGKPLACLLWLPLLLPSRHAPVEGAFELVMLDVGQGLSVVVRTARHALVYDMGPALPGGFDAGARVVVPALHAIGVRRLDAVVVSHGDNDHAGGWASVRRAFPAPAYVPDGSPVPGAFDCVAGHSWEWDGVRFRFLHPTPFFPYLGNEASCVLRIESPHGTALLTGDIGDVVERTILRADPAMVRADVVQVAHHGSRHSSDWDFVHATGATHALVAAGADSRFRHPAPLIVERWTGAGAHVSNTALGGALRVRVEPRGIRVEPRRGLDRRLWDAVRRRSAPP